MKILKSITRDKEDYFIMIKVLIHQEDTTLQNIFPSLRQAQNM